MNNPNIGRETVISSNVHQLNTNTVEQTKTRLASLFSENV